ncbi:MAG: hypothetical protein R3Y46_05685 [Opitutales bacterium]
MDDDNTKNIEDLECEKIVEDLSKAYKSIKHLENTISHRRIELNIERKLQELAKKKSQEPKKD